MTTKNITKTLVGLAILIGLAGSFGCQRSIEPTVKAGRTVTFEASDKTEKAIHYCNARTKENKPCHRRVKNEGDRCPLHQGKEAIPENWATLNCSTGSECEKQAKLIKELKAK